MGFTVMRRCQHPGCRVVVEVAHVQGRLELGVWRDRVHVTEHIDAPPEDRPRLCAEHQAEAQAASRATGRRRSGAGQVPTL